MTLWPVNDLKPIHAPPAACKRMDRQTDGILPQPSRPRRMPSFRCRRVCAATLLTLLSIGHLLVAFLKAVQYTEKKKQ